MRDCGARVEVKRLERRGLGERGVRCRRVVRERGSMVVASCCGFVGVGGGVVELRRERRLEK
jgi:hypothetical protein